MKKGFTLIELMIVILIIGILAAVAVPLMTARVEQAKFSEAKAAIGQIATAIRAKVAEDGAQPTDLDVETGFGFKANELDGKYFKTGDYTVNSVSYTASTGALGYQIEATGSGEGAPEDTITLTVTAGTGASAWTTTAPAGAGG